ncbi:hepatic lectin-like [Mercenaria mercenaria]|uniref:hepatic lectin-like n=1 Tax=Mercenaria mercenaria TaxID=6596 RepID=UPI00234E7B0F|nr:hepatic lectin-like [Mercenaria mercenaria]
MWLFDFVMNLLFLGVYCICPDGWLQYSGSCYMFGHGAVHFTEAEQFCRQHHNSHLIHVENMAENAFIKDRLREFKEKAWWIGLTDELAEGMWQWYDTQEIANFTDWNPTEPNNNGPGQGQEDCATFWDIFDFKWADLPCTSKFSPVCEKK